MPIKSWITLLCLLTFGITQAQDKKEEPPDTIGMSRSSRGWRSRRPHTATTGLAAKSANSPGRSRLRESPRNS